MGVSLNFLRRSIPPCLCQLSVATLTEENSARKRRGNEGEEERARRAGAGRAADYSCLESVDLEGSAY